MKLIDKAIVAAEIKRRRDASLMRQQNLKAIGQETVLNEMVAFELTKIISFLDTLEVKDVNLEKEISNYLKSHHLNIKDGGRIVFENGDSPNFLGDIRDIARHFFELGLKAQKEIEE